MSHGVKVRLRGSSVPCIELMIGGKKQEKAAKVITIPTDRTYQQGFRAEKREEPEADSEYMSRQAENALKKLRAIGG